jgi:molecular chaperone GrpE
MKVGSISKKNVSMARKNITKEEEIKDQDKIKSTDSKKDTKKTNHPKEDIEGGSKEKKTAGKEPDTDQSEEIKGDMEDSREESPLVKLAEMQDKYLRLSAEFDNYRRRTLKEKMDLTKTAGESLLVNLLPVMDDFERAMKVMENASDCKAMKDGIDLIYSKFREFLKQNGVKEIESDNCDFDTDLHDAVTKIPAPDKKLKGKVVDTIQKGYYLHEKVMRHSKVVIGE